MTKIENGRVHEQFSHYQMLDGTVSEVVHQYEEWALKYGVSIYDITYEQDYDGGIVSFWRDATDKELAAHKIKSDKAKERSRKLREAKEAKERKEYDRLKAKYG